MKIYWMSRGGNNPSLRLWINIKLGKYWYSFMWKKKFKPYLYRSTDATPPYHDNEGKWYFGHQAYIDGS